MIEHSSLINWVGAAYDGGPRQVIEAVADASACQILSLNEGEPKSSAYWLKYFEDNNVRGLICSTSQSKEGFQVEATIRCGASLANIPIICIEDFPGNYQEVERAATSLLVVEDSFSLDIYRSRYDALPPTLTMPSVRYDSLRHKHFDWQVSTASPPFQVLWAGQPEPECCFKSLETVLPELKKHPVKLLFRAHPRDPEYIRGTYLQLLKQHEVDWVDVTQVPVEKLFLEPIHLVITQFSSLAAEAGFYGIPALYVLLREAGGGLLLAKNGYVIPMAVANNAAFAIFSGKEIPELEAALYDIGRRAQIMRDFVDLYKVDKVQSPFLVNAIEGIISQR